MRRSCYNHDTHALKKFHRGKFVIIHPSCMNSIGRLMTSSQSWGWDNSGEEPAVLAGGRDQIAFRWLPNDEAWKPMEVRKEVFEWCFGDFLEGGIFGGLGGRLFFSSLARQALWQCRQLLQRRYKNPSTFGIEVLMVVDATCRTRGDTVLERLYPDLLWLQDQKQQQRPRVFSQMSACSKHFRVSDRSDKHNRHDRCDRWRTSKLHEFHSVCRCLAFCYFRPYFLKETGPNTQPSFVDWRFQRATSLSWLCQASNASVKQEWVYCIFDLSLWNGSKVLLQRGNLSKYRDPFGYGMIFYILNVFFACCMVEICWNAEWS